MINLNSISHQYPKGQVIKFPDWNIEYKEQWLLMGVSGSGKSTLLNIISGLLRPTQGDVKFDDVNLYGLSAKRMDKFRGQKIGIVFQRPHLIRSLTVIENLEIAASMAGCKFDKQRIKLILNDLGLNEKQSSYPEELSQGQLQRVSVARALVNKPSLLIADEPTSSLDDKNTIQVLEMLTNQAQNNGAALIIATHDQRVRNHITKAYLL
ncbi:ABC transporter ATP-binding protein [Pedobacter sp. Leaf132]|uniref:ABC transporter ATP-binding protein n=1 Tax=Pedobacter sp. Leaf132 TaxID=2876557 RepID=UPI001E58BAFB|nr:ABC transporter ATP-binding protein [Pedobacter sp. Leaf132]